MAAPVLANRSVAFVNKVGTDDAGYNAVGRPESFLTIAAALADLAANYPAASLTNPHVVAVGPGFFTTAAFALPPFTFIQGSADDESGITTILSMTGNITLAAAWSVNATKNGGLCNLTIRASSGTPVIDFTVPTPAAGNPIRTVELENVRTDLDVVSYEATSTADRLNVQRLVHDGANTNDIEFSGGTQLIDNLVSGAIVTLNDAGAIANSCQAYGIFITNASSSLRCISTGAGGTVIRLGACDNRNLFLSETAPGVIAVSADAVSIPLIANVTFGGTATNADLTRTTDAGGFAGGITGPASSTLDALVRWNNTTGSLVKDSNVTLADGGTALVFSAAGGMTAGGANNLTLTPGAANLLALHPAATSGFMTFGAATLAPVLNVGGGLTMRGNVTRQSVGVRLQAVDGINVITADADIFSAGTLTLGIYDNLVGGYAVRVSGTTRNILLGGLTVDGTGLLQFPAATTNAGGLNFGTEVFFFRTGANAAQISASAGLTMTGPITTLGGATFHTTSTALANGAAASVGTLTNAPAAGDPTKWIGINDNGTTRYIPSW